MTKRRKPAAERPKRAYSYALLGACALSGLLFSSPGIAQQAANMLGLRGSTSTTTPVTDGASTDPATPDTTNTPPASRTNRDDETTTLDSDSFRRITNDALDANRLNLRQSALDDRRSLKKTNDDGTGIRLGTMILRPEVSQGVSVERKSDSSGNRQNTTFWDNGLKGTLTSDWSRHELTVTGNGLWRQRIAGDRDNDPSGQVNAALRLDLADDLAARLTTGYAYSRESNTDPNAIRNALVQSGVGQFTAGAVLSRDVGKLRGSLGLQFQRWTYSNAQLSDGSTLSNSDRNRNTVTVSSRLGYEISPAFTPFVEVSVGKTRYDQTSDSAGYQRSGNIYGAKAGISSDMGEKLRGEVAIGYEHASFDDARLDGMGAMTLDSTVNWSPRRGTDVALGFGTSIEPSTTAGISGDVAYALTAAVTHELRENLIARLSGGTTWRNYDSASQLNSIYYTAGAGLTYRINRYLDLTADLAWARTSNDNGSSDRSLTAGVGLTLKR
ncbi:outer membrane beta-barrel protein [Rhizobium oryziradicis]|uniref:Outer membrane beta-barrel protein n=1 Tax=Rhizobium oryziradicis TaxID=1867956 RepID=A0A1Q8ZPT0_9HYPH|nr:outer membrane beta-barrel protein [Rhizobium oryziradicis]OLP44056.1 hypothetical protein BJF95_05635 [Rhizobium oryziradicis]